jgi:glyoxylase-like metal-dependent hydrolase (beta-lactamase superfamily II)
MTIRAITHKHTSMYVIGNGSRYVLFDCLWQDSFPVIKNTLKEFGIGFEQIAGLFVSHFHPDHAGAFQVLCQHGVMPMVLEWQMSHIEWLNRFFAQPKNDPIERYMPINIATLTPIKLDVARDTLRSCGIDGRILHTPGHSEDGISLIAGNAAFVGDLPRIENADGYGSKIMADWRKISACKVTEIYYAHGQTRIITMAVKERTQ